MWLATLSLFNLPAFVFIPENVTTPSQLASAFSKFFSMIRIKSAFGPDQPESAVRIIPSSKPNIIIETIISDERTRVRLGLVISDDNFDNVPEHFQSLGRAENRRRSFLFPAVGYLCCIICTLIFRLGQQFVQNAFAD
jgi:hypothetical protein